MEENKKKYNPTGIWAPNKVVAILIYIFVTFILAGLLLYFFSYIYANVNHLSYDEIVKSLTMKSDDFSNLSDDILKANAIVQGLGNLFSYLIACILVCFFTRDELCTDLFKFREKKKFYYWHIPVVVILFCLIGYGIDKLILVFTTSTENQIQIENIIKNGGLIPMIISTVLLAPVVEEIIYRKCIFSLCKNRLLLAYAASIILFAFPHMLTTSATFGDWVLKSIPYLASGLMLATIYHLSGFNVYVSIMAHMANNILAVILVFI